MIRFSLTSKVIGIVVAVLAMFAMALPDEHAHKVSPFDILKIQVLIERSGRIKAEYEKLQADVQHEIRNEVARIYGDAGLKQTEFDLDLQKAEFTPKKEGSK